MKTSCELRNQVGCSAEARYTVLLKKRLLPHQGRHRVGCQRHVHRLCSQGYLQLARLPAIRQDEHAAPIGVLCGDMVDIRDITVRSEYLCTTLEMFRVMCEGVIQAAVAQRLRMGIDSDDSRALERPYVW